ncbi:MAG TPA: universal stress protein [Puia sp.]|nr:universal stress protein [Puia sp.]
MRTIVVPVSFSPASNNAARYAADLAAVIGANLQLIHVLQLPFAALEYPTPDGALEAFRNSVATQLKELAAELNKRTTGRVPVELDIEQGGVEYKVRKYCKEVQPFLVVMGSAGSSLDRFIAGSATLQTLRRLSYPVLVIPEGVKFEQPERILLACDLEDIHSGMMGATGFLRELKDLLAARFDVVNITTPAETGQGETGYTYEALRSRMKDIYPDLHFVHTDKVEKGIGEYLKDHPADWLIVFPKKHPFYELHSSQAKKIVLHSPIPVISIHE